MLSLGGADRRSHKVEAARPFRGWRPRAPAPSALPRPNICDPRRILHGAPCGKLFRSNGWLLYLLSRFIRASTTPRSSFCAFDVLALDGEDLRELPLSMRKTNLERLLRGLPDGIFINPFETGAVGPDLFRAACDMGTDAPHILARAPTNALRAACGSAEYLSDELASDRCDGRS
jgi:hypothetical protein